MEILELKSTVTKMKTSLGVLTLYMWAARRIKDQLIEIQFEEQREKRMKKNKESLREMWDTIKCINIHKRVTEEERKEQKKCLKK